MYQPRQLYTCMHVAAAAPWGQPAVLGSMQPHPAPNLRQGVHVDKDEPALSACFCLLTSSMLKLQLQLYDTPSHAGHIHTRQRNNTSSSQPALRNKRGMHYCHATNCARNCRATELGDRPVLHLHCTVPFSCCTATGHKEYNTSHLRDTGSQAAFYLCYTTPCLHWRHERHKPHVCTPGMKNNCVACITIRHSDLR